MFMFLSSDKIIDLTQLCTSLFFMYKGPDVTEDPCSQECLYDKDEVKGHSNLSFSVMTDISFWH